MMREKDRMRRIVEGQQGMALVSALLLLLVVTLLALGISTDTSIDVRIAAYQRFKARAFGFAESGMMAATDILEANIYDAGWDDKLPALPAVLPLPDLSANYTGTLDIMGDRVFYMDANTVRAQIMDMTGDIQADIITQRVGSKLAKGGAIQMAAGYAGMGKGMGGGGGHIIYNVESVGQDSDQSRSNTALHYRHLTK